MGKAELGTKCTCVSCGERFYDLNRTPATCPKCATAQPPPVAKVYRVTRASPGKGAFDRRPRPAVAEEAADEVVVDDAEESADADDDVAEIDDDDDDDAVVIEIDPDHDKAMS